jgi:uncharacterized protein UPF0259
VLKTVLRRGWRTSRREFWTIAPLVALILTPAAILSGAVRQLVDSASWDGLLADLVISGAAVAISGIGYFFLAGSIAEVVVAERRGTVRRSFRALALAIPYATLIVVDLVVTSAITLGIELLVIPGLIVAARFGMAPVLIEVEHDGAGDSLRRSLELSRGASFSVGAVLLAVLVLTTVLAVPLKLLAAEVLNDTLAEMVGLLLAGILVKPLGAVIEVELALELIDRREAEEAAGVAAA